MLPEALAIAQHNQMVCPIKHHPRYKTYVPPQDCPVLKRLLEAAPELIKEAKIEEERILADRLLGLS